MPVPASAHTSSQGLYRFSGIYGRAYRDSELLTDVVEVSGAVDLNRIDVVLPGQSRQGYKPGRQTREGTIRIQKIDTKWEWEVYQYMKLDDTERRRRRDRGEPSIRPFSIVFEYDDPDALGIESWQLDGCLIWRLPLGFASTDDLVDREFPLTWEDEQPIFAFSAVRAGTGTPAAHYYTQRPSGTGR